MRLAVLADIHGNQLALEAVLNDLKQAGGADKVWVLGDLCLIGPRPAECLQLIRAIPSVQVISGNTDRWLLTGQFPLPRPKDEAGWQQWPTQLRQAAQNVDWTLSKLSFADFEYLSKLHQGVDLDAPGYGWAIGFHGGPGDDERRLVAETPDEELLDQFLDQEGRLGFGGHTHLPLDRDLGRWRYVNVGSIGMPQDEARACYVIATFEGDKATIEFRRLAYDVDAVLKDLQQVGHSELDWLQTRFRKQ
jgi:predicted phosphodiesterase